MKRKYPVYRQLENVDCAPTCLRMIAKFYGKKYALEELRDLCGITRVGASLKDISNASTIMGFDNAVVRVSLNEIEEVPLPCILHWRQDHFVVLYDIKNHQNAENSTYVIADPAFGLIKLNQERFLREWGPKQGKGVALLLQPNDNYSTIRPQNLVQPNWLRTWKFISKYLLEHRNTLIYTALTLLVSAAISWVFPILMQKLIDDGVSAKNINVVWVILASQLLLFIGRGTLEWIRGLILIHVSMKVSIDIISSFIKKLIRLPIEFFDTKLPTDILQRVGDQNKIEEFISYKLLSSIFSFVTLIALSALLGYYNLYVFLIFIFLTAISIIWMLLFLKKRKYLDYSRFSLQAIDQNNLYELVVGMAEIKINSAQEFKVEEWSNTQKKLYELKIQALNLNTHQLWGSDMITQIKNIIITFFCSYLVIKEQMTLGVLMSISFTVGQLSRPLDELVSFFLGAQDAKLSFDRMDEILRRKEESKDKKKINSFENKIVIEDMWFKYQGSNSPYVLKNIDIEIPLGKRIAIVGTSGSGKTTLMKLLLKFYDPSSGVIKVDNENLSDLNSDYYLSNCGVVLQNGFIYSGTITSNIALGEKHPDIDKVKWAARVACIDEFVEKLVSKYDTKIGQTGVDLSGGQKQRLLIARALYKEPDFLFFDEATSALDADNERKIVDNLDLFLAGKSVFVIAHRLSTVQNADLIIVLNDGEIVEYGSHLDLTLCKGYYYNLIKNQLEFGV